MQALPRLGAPYVVKTPTVPADKWGLPRNHETFVKQLTY
jgi:hypothetical protein